MLYTYGLRKVSTAAFAVSTQSGSGGAAVAGRDLGGVVAGRGRGRKGV